MEYLMPEFPTCYFQDKCSVSPMSFDPIPPIHWRLWQLLNSDVAVDLTATMMRIADELMGVYEFDRGIRFSCYTDGTVKEKVLIFFFFFNKLLVRNQTNFKLGNYSFDDNEF